MLLFETWKLILVTMIVSVTVDGDLTTISDGYKSTAHHSSRFSSLDCQPRRIKTYCVGVCWVLCRTFRLQTGLIVVLFLGKNIC